MQITSREFSTTRYLCSGAKIAGGLASRLFRIEHDVYELQIFPRFNGPRGAFEFLWTPRSRGLLPPLQGTLTVRHFGPLTAMTLRATYRVGDDPSSRFLHEGAGRHMARRGLACVSSAIASLLRPATSETQAKRESYRQV